MLDPWHFARPDDATKIVETLRIGLVSAVAIIEPRRRGKTTFLLQDLIPAAKAAGFLPLYVNLAASTGELEDHIATAVRDALQDTTSTSGSIKGALKAVGQSRIKKLTGKVSATAIELAGELEAPHPPQRGVLANTFREIAALRQPTLFLLDEVHKLGDASASALAWSLRSLLDTHRTSMKVVATSSSAASYDFLVSGEKKAFNRWFTRAALAPLGSAFVAHLAQVKTKYYPKHPVSTADLSLAFDALGQSPKFLRDYLNLRLLNPSLAHGLALQEASTEAARESGYEDAFARLLPLQKLILMAVASGQKEMFSDDTLTAAGSVLSGEPVPKTLMQKAVRALAMNGWVFRQGRGEYALADPLFERWIGEHETD